MGILTPNTSFYTTYYEKGRYLFAWRLMLILNISIFMLMIANFNVNYRDAFSYLISFGFTTFSLLYLFFTKKYKLVYYIVAIVGTILCSYSLNNNANLIHISDYLWHLLTVLITFFGLGLTAGIVVSVFMGLNSSYYLFYSLENNINQIVDFSSSIKTGLVLELLLVIALISYLVFQFVVFHNYSLKKILNTNTALSKQNKIITKQNKENSILVQEIHHRVKNNLQIIISLLRLQKNQIKSEELQTQFSEAIARIMTMSLIHKKLYGGKDFVNVELESYFNELIKEIASSYNELVNFDYKINSKVKKVNLETIVPLGLLVNELITNSLKHAFASVEHPFIAIDIDKIDDMLILKYSDNGEGHFYDKNKVTFGKELIEILTNQLNGTYKLNTNSNGTIYTFKFKNIL